MQSSCIFAVTTIAFAVPAIAHADSRRSDKIVQIAACADDVRKASRLNPDDASACNSMSIIFHNLLRGQHTSVASDITSHSNDKVPRYFKTKANAHSRAGNVDRSISDRKIELNKGVCSPKKIQRVLNDKGYYSGSIDGKFGNHAKHALTDWTGNGCRQNCLSPA